MKSWFCMWITPFYNPFLLAKKCSPLFGVRKVLTKLIIITKCAHFAQSLIIIMGTHTKFEDNTYASTTYRLERSLVVETVHCSLFSLLLLPSQRSWEEGQSFSQQILPSWGCGLVHHPLPAWKKKNYAVTDTQSCDMQSKADWSPAETVKERTVLPF